MSSLFNKRAVDIFMIIASVCSVIGCIPIIYHALKWFHLKLHPPPAADMPLHLRQAIVIINDHTRNQRELIPVQSINTRIEELQRFCEQNLQELVMLSKQIKELVQESTIQSGAGGGSVEELTNQIKELVEIVKSSGGSVEELTNQIKEFVETVKPGGSGGVQPGEGGVGVQPGGGGLVDGGRGEDHVESRRHSI